jgi:hypothetical protein
MPPGELMSPEEIYDRVFAFLSEKNHTLQDLYDPQVKSEILSSPEPLIKQAAEFKLSDALESGHLQPDKFR